MSKADDLYAKGDALYKSGKYAAAEACFRELFKVVPRDQKKKRGRAAYSLALSLIKQARTNEAREALNAALEADPTLDRARERLNALTSNPVSAVTSKDTDLMLPASDPEFVDYEKRKRRKAIIDYQADYAAQLIALPAWAKVVTVLIAMLIVGFFIFWFYQAFTTSDIERQGQQIQERMCEQAAKQGAKPPGCE